MSHLKERVEKICLNCNAAIYGRYCHVCGQENIEPRESFWHLVTHFLFDLIHFDGKFFSTLKYLLFKPGYLAEEHSRGRRADYLHPIRLYIFVSAFFFLIMFSFYGNEHQSKKEFYEDKMELLNTRKEFIRGLIKNDSLVGYQKNIADSFIAIINLDSTKFSIDSSKKYHFLSSNLDLKKISSNYKNPKSFNTSLGFLNSYFEKKRDEYSSAEDFNKAFITTLTHSIPKGLFVALPFYALFLMLFYVRNQNFNYVNHLLFSIYLFSFTFILILFSTWLVSLFSLFDIDVEGLMIMIAVVLAMLYTYKGLRYYYKQSRTKTILKFILLSVSCFIIITIISILLFAYAAKTV